MDPAEGDLRLPALRLLRDNPAGLTTSEVISSLRRALNPVGSALSTLTNRPDDRFSQRVRNLFISDPARQNSLPNLGYVYQQSGARSAWVISEAGLQFLLGDISLEPVQPPIEELSEEDGVYEPEASQPLPREGRPRRVITQAVDLSIQTLVEQIDEGSIRLETDFQRRYIWDDAKASRLIESLLLNIPIPVCYFAEEPSSGAYEVVDGHQRLYSIWRFLKGDLPLRGLTELQDLNSLRFHKLPGLQQRDLQRRTIRCIVITRESDADLKFEVFERLNTNSVALTAQEIRNCVFRGAMNDLIKDLVFAPSYRSALNRPEPDIRMRDHELILRFFAISDALPKYRPPLKKLLSDYMNVNRTLPDERVGQLRSRFLEAVDRVATVFGPGAFRRIDSDGAPVESTVNRALFDAQMICFERADRLSLERHREAVIAGQAQLFNDAEFMDAITLSTADATKLATRLAMTAKVLHQSGVRIDPATVSVILEKN